MEPVKLYFAGAWSGKCSDHEVDLGIRNKLVSYHYPDQLKSWLIVAKDIPGNIIVDSGAFSAWNRNKVIDLNDYITYAHKAIEDGKKTNKVVRVVNLDVIPGKAGQTAELNKIIVSREKMDQNKDLIEMAAKQGYMNLRTMVKEGITPIHVFHQGEHWRWLDRMLNHTDYIGISPANDMSTNSKKDWIYSVFEYLYKHNIKVDTHGFAVWITSLLRDLPWTSADAASWRLVAGYGKIFYPNKGFKNPISVSEGSKSFDIISVTKRKSAKGLGQLTEEKLKLIEEDGYTYEQLQEWSIRAEINIKFFLTLEQQLNKHKQNTTYTPHNKIKYNYNE